MSKQKEHEVIKLYTKGLTPYEISKIFNCSASDIRIQLHKAGYSVYGRDNDTLILPEEIEQAREFPKYGSGHAERNLHEIYKHIQTYLYQCSEGSNFSSPLYLAISQVFDKVAHALVSNICS